VEELEVYDMIGIEYYYLNDIPKAQFYHERMMKGEIEPISLEKVQNLKELENKCKERNSRDKKIKLTIFETYKLFIESHSIIETIILPHENPKELFKLNLRKTKYARAEPLISPKFNYIDLKTKIINSINKEALAECQSDTIKMQRIMKRLLTKQVKIYKYSKEECKRTSKKLNITEFMLSNPVKYNYENPGKIIIRV
jgi:hypothetical protein